jgi:ubiquinone/menaquinone biosynthesis C-methylase UbiE
VKRFINTDNYIHGTSDFEQNRLSKLNELTNGSYVDFLNIQQSDLILELGSGIGILADLISRKLGQGKVVGIELFDEQLRRCPPNTRNLEFVKGDVHDLPFEDSTFDKVCCRYILEHVKDPASVLLEALRVLKPNGEIYIQENSTLLFDFYPDCPNFKHAWLKFTELQKQINGDPMIGIKLYSLLKKVGFKNIVLCAAPEIHYTEKGTLVPWIDNLVGNIEGARQKLIEFQLLDNKEIDLAVEELNEFKLNEFSSSYFYWNRANATAL